MLDATLFFRADMVDVMGLVTPKQRLDMLREWLEKAEETGHYRGMSRHEIFLMIAKHLKEYDPCGLFKDQ